MTVLDYSVIVVYLIGVPAVGLFSSRGKKNSKSEYLVGGRSIPWLASAASLVATGISCKSLIGLPGLAYARDLTYLQMYLVLPLAAFIAARLFVPLYSELRVTSAYEYLGKRFGPGVQSYGSLIFQIETALMLGTVIAAPSLVMSEATGLSYWISAVILLVATTLYTSIGGMKAVIWTDVVQLFVFAAVPIVLLLYLLFTFDGGALALVASAAELGKLKTFDFSFNLTAEVTVWSAFSSMLFWHAGNQCVNQVLVQRYITAPSVRERRKAILLSSGGIVSLWALFLLFGALLFAYNARYPGVVPPDAGPDRIFTAFVMARVPSGLKGAFIAAAFAAGMSTLSSMLNSMGTVTVVDLWELHAFDKADEATWVRRARVLTALWGVFGFGAALFVLRFGTVITAGIKLGSVITGALMGMFLLGMFARRVGAAAAVGGSISGMLTVILVMVFTGISWSWYCGISTAVTFLAGCLISSVLSVGSIKGPSHRVSVQASSADSTRLA